MSPKCKCGGRFVTVDWNRLCNKVYERELYETVRLNIGYATWRCDKCGKEQKQKLRTSVR